MFQGGTSVPFTSCGAGWMLTTAGRWWAKGWGCHPFLPTPAEEEGEAVGFGVLGLVPARWDAARRGLCLLRDPLKVRCEGVSCPPQAWLEFALGLGEMAAWSRGTIKR